MLRNKAQNKRLHTLLSELGFEKEELASYKKEQALIYSNGRTDSTSALLVTECQAFINNLATMRPKSRTAREKEDQIQDPANRMRRKILSMCREMGGDWMRNGTYNWPYINGFLLKRGCYKEIHEGTVVTDKTTYELLNQYSVKQLPKLVTQFENMMLKPHAKG